MLAAYGTQMMQGPPAVLSACLFRCLMKALVRFKAVGRHALSGMGNKLWKVVAKHSWVCGRRRLCYGSF